MAFHWLSCESLIPYALSRQEKVFLSPLGLCYCCRARERPLWPPYSFVCVCVCVCVCVQVIIYIDIDISEKALAPHSSTLAWKIPWTEEPGGLQSMGLLRVGHD